MIAIILTILLAVLISYIIFRKKNTGVYEEPRILCVFPDYDRDNPFEARLGDSLRFEVRGYCDRQMMTEVRLNEEEIEWQHQNYVGFFDNTKSDKIKGFREIFYNLPDGIENKGKLIYLTARYRGLQDTTWIKIQEV